jgi:hypothetical protein
MDDSSTGRSVGRREVAAVAVVAAMVVGSHLLAPAVVPAYAEYARYATYLVAFSVWMAWFVDWLAVWLGQDPHPSERDGAD